jgi:hypothetical protein
MHTCIIILLLKTIAGLYIYGVDIINSLNVIRLSAFNFIITEL